VSAAWPALAGLFSGAALMWAFRRFGDARALRAAVSRIQACLLEFWLYVDEPLLAIRTWKDLLAAQARLLRLLGPPALVATVAMAPVFYFLEAFYGREPLRPGAPALVTAGVRLSPAAPRLIVPEGIAVELPPVRVPARHQVSWRIRPARALQSHIILESGFQTVRKSIVAGSGAHWVSRRRGAAGLDFLLHPFERPAPKGPVEWIEITYSPAAVTLFGVSWHWSVWFTLGSLAGALLLPRGAHAKIGPIWRRRN
jgi:hypothetical protein